mmetsp:Transcript_25523/g.34111  ORF Transcript_25523/g.34111 Transcript_25523/m.34111 type:complete len:166 (+) Transcript_25523:315-812(+)
MHTIIDPLADKLPAVGPDIRPQAFHLVTDEGALEMGAILPAEAALAILASLFILAFIDGAVGPDLLAGAMMLVIAPIALIVCAIGVIVAALAEGHVLLPVTQIVVTVCVDEPALALLLIVQEVTVVAGAISPNLGSSPVPHRARPLASVFNLRHLHDNLLFFFNS